RIAGHFQPSQCFPRARSNMVRTLRRRVMDCRSRRCKKIGARRALTALQNGLDADLGSGLVRDFFSVMFWYVVIGKLSDRLVRGTNKPDTLFSHARLRARLFFALIEIRSCFDNNSAILGKP